MYLRCGGERGGGPERADDTCLAKILVLRLRCRAGGWDFSYKAMIKATRVGIGASRLVLESEG